MDTGDIVIHKPTGEKWVVAFVDGERLSWCGWPEGLAYTKDCVLLEHARPEERLTLLHQLATMDGLDSRKTYAKNRLARAEEILPREY